MTLYETMLSDLGDGLGLNLKPEGDGVVQIAVEGRIVLMKPLAGEEAAVAMAIVATATEDGAFSVKTLEKALSLGLFGRGTAGGHIGLFGDSLILSREFALAGETPEAFAEMLLAFARNATEIEEKLSSPSSEPSPAISNAVLDQLSSLLYRV